MSLLDVVFLVEDKLVWRGQLPDQVLHGLRARLRNRVVEQKVGQGKLGLVHGNERHELLPL